MLIRDMSERVLAPAYGIKYRQVYPHGGEELAPWGFGRAVVEPGGRTEPHEHDEHEVFLIVAGQGEMTIGDERAVVSADSAVVIPAGERHHISNPSPTERLVFFSVYWPRAHGAPDL